MMANSRGTLYALGEIARRQEESLRARKAAWSGKGFESYATFSCWYGMLSENNLSSPPLNWKNN